MDSLGEYDSDDVKLVISDIELIIDVVDGISAKDGLRSEVIIPEAETRHVRLNFPLNSRIAELVKQDKLSIYATATTPLSNIVLDGSDFYNLIRLGNIKRFAKMTGDGLSEDVVEEFTRIRDGADRVELDILPWSDLLTQLEEIVDEETRHEFERLIEAARIENLGALDDISVAIIAAAQSEALLYDLGKWAEEVGLASKATFSRRKQNLEEEGLIYTEKVPVEVGRPRLRLMLSEDINAVGVQGDELDIIREGEWSDSVSESGVATDAESTTEETTTEESAYGDDDLQILEEELKEAIRSN